MKKSTQSKADKKPPATQHILATAPGVQIAPPAANDAFDLTQAPFLGPTRVRALANAGISTLAQLRAAPPDDIGRITGMGLRNALRVKEWLAAQAAPKPGLPPPPPNIDMAAQGGVSLSDVSCDPKQAETNQTIYDELENLEQQLANLRVAIGPKNLKKRLASQFDKLSLVACELVEGPDTLTTKSTHRSAKELKKVVGALEKASKRKSYSPRKQDLLAETVREHRKFLQRLIGD